MTLRGWTGAVLGLALLHAATAGALSPADKCVAAKLKVAGKYSFCRLKTDAKAIRTGARADYAICDSAFAKKWAKAEANGSCPTAADKTNVQGQLLADAAFILQKITLPRFVDNGDGTVTDIHTALMWEKKDNLGGIHDTANRYSWSATGTSPDGTAFTIFLGTLNNGTSDGTTMSGCFAGHCDWRVPTLVELQTILDLSACTPTGVCIDEALMPLGLGAYWSSTTDANSPSDAWWVNFFQGPGLGFGGSYTFPKSGYGEGEGGLVRAVRGGL